jgi:hypothetical protein
MRKGELTERRIDCDFPHQVVILIPEGGLVARLMAVHKFSDTRSMPYKTRSDLRREPPSDYVRFCFSDPAHTDAFMAEFGGKKITIEPHTAVWPVLTNTSYSVKRSSALFTSATVVACAWAVAQAERLRMRCEHFILRGSR